MLVSSLHNRDLNETNWKFRRHYTVEYGSDFIKEQTDWHNFFMLISVTSQNDQKWMQCTGETTYRRIGIFFTLFILLFCLIFFIVIWALLISNNRLFGSKNLVPV